MPELEHDNPHQPEAEVQDDDTTPAPDGATLVITITDLPILPTDDRARHDAIQALAEQFGRMTVESGFNKAADMPTEVSYQAATATVMMMMRQGKIGLPLLVNLIAALHHHHLEAGS